MAQSIQTNSSFWQGIAAGFLTGLAVAAALRYSKFEKFLTNLSTVEGKLATLEERLNPSPAFVSRRDLPESSGDPRNLASARTGKAAEFTRPGGAPHGREEPEFLESPGRPGEPVDPSKPVRAYSRSLDLGSAG